MRGYEFAGWLAQFRFLFFGFLQFELQLSFTVRPKLILRKQCKNNSKPHLPSSSGTFWWYFPNLYIQNSQSWAVSNFHLRFRLANRKLSSNKKKCGWRFAVPRFQLAVIDCKPITASAHLWMFPIREPNIDPQGVHNLRRPRTWLPGQRGLPGPPGLLPQGPQDAHSVHPVRVRRWVGNLHSLCSSDAQKFLAIFEHI